MSPPKAGVALSRRAFLKTSAAAAAGTVLGSPLLTACTNGGPSELLRRARSEGSLPIGFADQPPYAFRDEEGVLTGAAVEVVREVLTRLGVETVAGVRADFGALVSDLEAGRFDVIASGMFIVPQRCERIVFSDPDFCIPEVFVVPEGNPLGLRSFADVAEQTKVRIGLQTGSFEIQYARSAQVEDEQIELFPDPHRMIEALGEGEIDVTALPSITVRDLLGKLDDPRIQMTKPFVPIVDGEERLGCNGYGFRKGDADFRDEFNAVLTEMKDADEILPILEEFGLTEAEVDLATERTAETLCAG